MTQPRLFLKSFATGVSLHGFVSEGNYFVRAQGPVCVFVECVRYPRDRYIALKGESAASAAAAFVIRCYVFSADLHFIVNQSLPERVDPANAQMMYPLPWLARRAPSHPVFDYDYVVVNEESDVVNLMASDLDSALHYLASVDSTEKFTQLFFQSMPAHYNTGHQIPWAVAVYCAVIDPNEVPVGLVESRDVAAIQQVYQVLESTAIAFR